MQVKHGCRPNSLKKPAPLLAALLPKSAHTLYHEEKVKVKQKAKVAEIPSRADGVCAQRQGLLHQILAESEPAEQSKGRTRASAQPVASFLSNY